MNSNSLFGRLFVIVIPGGAFEFGMEILGKPLSQMQSLTGVVMMERALIAWLLDDVLTALIRILDEIKKE